MSKFTEEGDAAAAFPVIRDWLEILGTPEVLLFPLKSTGRVHAMLLYDDDTHHRLHL